jgi:alcohol dehydrogenase YqhD (iron-dependent ADH family)
MKCTLLQILSDTTKMVTNTKTGTSSTNNYWMWIAVAEFLVIGYLTFKLVNKKKVKFEQAGGDILNEAKNSNVDMDNLMNSINKSRQLYKQLSAKCHPDRFPADEEKRKMADELFQDITKNQRNYNKLLELQEEAKQKLNITI